MWIGYAKIVVISFHNEIIKLPAKLTGTLISKLLCCVCFVKMCLHGLLLISFMLQLQSALNYESGCSLFDNLINWATFHKSHIRLYYKLLHVSIFCKNRDVTK